MVDTALAHFGDLHAVVNNAGFVRDRMFATCTPEEWDGRSSACICAAISAPAGTPWNIGARNKKPETEWPRASSTPPRAPGCRGSIGQSAYSAAKGGIATLTLVQAAELGRYGITANALAPNARTRMTATGAFDMNVDAGAFDVFAPENMAPLVAWLCSEESQDVTGQVFELKGGNIFLSEGWTDSPAEDKGARWEAAELGPVVRRLLAARRPAKPVYGA